MSVEGFAARAAAARLLAGVFVEKRFLDEADLTSLAPPERARAKALARGVLRHRDALDAAIDPHLDRTTPLRARNILRAACHEMLVEGIPPHAAVSGAVSVAKAGKKTASFAGLINAVARKLDGSPFTASPQKLVPDLRGALVKLHGEDVTAAIEALLMQPVPLDLTPRDAGEAEALASELGGTLLPTGSIRLAKYGQVSALPGFERGAWWVQDAAAALPARLLGDVTGARVLDLCAAPGGKTMQLAAKGADVTALDLSEDRLARLAENLERTGLTADIVAADALEFVPDAPYDAILLDAPCSATGTIRRHPELPVIREGSDLQPILKLQRKLLSRALGWLAPGGRLVYCTCSLLPVEGERQIKDATLAPLPDLPGVPDTWLSGGMLRTRPDYWADLGGVDGFFAAAIVP